MIFGTIQFSMSPAKISPASSKYVGIVSKPAKPELKHIVPGLLEWFRKHNYKLLADPETAIYAPDIEIVDRADMSTRPLDFVIVLGGDGTLLSAARSVAKAAIPVLGINLGSLGFLTEVPLEELYSTLQGIEEGAGSVESRSMIHCDVVRAGSHIARFDAVNDIVVGKGSIARLNHCDVFIDDVFVASYKADSLIVATPTGSTAYSLAAGGPILMPSVDAFVITPVSAHSLTHRALVVNDTANVEVVVKTGEDEAYLSVDGQIGMPMQDGDRVLCRKSEYKIRLLRIKGSFFDVLRSKMKWGQT
jgi:NAD+ kinase